MQENQNNKVTVEVTIQVPVEKAWEYFVNPEHIKKWNSPSDDWHTPFAENDVKVGGKFLSRMEAKDGSFGFDFAGTYDAVQLHEVISYSMEDGREVSTTFTAEGTTTKVTQVFDAETQNPIEFQKQGWQAILDNFKKYTEKN